MNPIEIVGVVTALAYLLLAMKENPLCWFAAIVSSLCYIAVFYEASLFTESLLQLFFIGMAFQGLRRWKLGEGESGQLQIRTLPIRSHLIGIVVCGALSLLLSIVVRSLTEAPLALIDSAITVFSIYTTWLVTEKVLENWLYWIVIDLIAVVVYFVKDLHFTAGLFLLYVILATIGYFQWLSAMGSSLSEEATA